MFVIVTQWICSPRLLFKVYILLLPYLWGSVTKFVSVTSMLLWLPHKTETTQASKDLFGLRVSSCFSMPVGKTWENGPVCGECRPYNGGLFTWLWNRKENAADTKGDRNLQTHSSLEILKWQCPDVILILLASCPLPGSLAAESPRTQSLCPCSQHDS